MSEISLMQNRPPVQRITYTSAEGNPCVFEVGRGCTDIREVLDYGEYTTIPWIEVWDRSSLLARFNQHKLEHIIYKRTA